VTVQPSDRDLKLRGVRAARTTRTTAPRSAAEPCPSCGAPIALDEAYCLTCGASRGVCESTPRETYLRACVAALELLRDAHRRVRPLADTVRAERDIEAAIGKLRVGCAL
jgi:hypothetical protein